jgi:enterobactin synthetase component F
VVQPEITPGAIMNIAEAVEISGPIKPEVFQQALRGLVTEAELRPRNNNPAESFE